MMVHDRVVAITGGGAGLGAAACRRAEELGAAAIAVLDIDGDAAAAVASEVGGLAVRCDVSSEADLRNAIDSAQGELGAIDIFISNAGVGGFSDPFTSDDHWLREYAIHVMSNVYAARALLPGMLARSSGHLAAVASANALTSNPVALAYSVTKHAQLALAEWLAFTYASRRIEASCFCPKGMLTPMMKAGAGATAYGRDAMATAVTPEAAATMLFDTIESGHFLGITHPAVVEDFSSKFPDYDAYIGRMAELHDRLVPEVGAP
ncbi:SDR family NAD(P)-dependent oxidoreductase [Gordonia mangrovi]|nr:SDR family oxidoreductase [Gordonia mangrovi]UVF76590.1 SDR family oxidoreductase [Gordonia mangrovi]